MFGLELTKALERPVFKTLPAREYFCEVHGFYKGSPKEFLGRSLGVDCPQCEQAQVASERADAAKRREAQDREEREKRLTDMNIGKRFWDESFDTFNAYTSTLQKNLSVCKTFARDHNGRMLVMLGKNGNGKNHLASSILKQTSGCMYSVFEIELLLKECYSGKTGETELYRRLCAIPMLVINEIGKHKSGEWETNFLSYIINKRYENLMPTILISNTHLLKHYPKSENGCDECLQKYLGQDVLSRIAESGEVMRFNESDYRYRKRPLGIVGKE